MSIGFPSGVFRFKLSFVTRERRPKSATERPKLREVGSDESIDPVEASRAEAAREGFDQSSAVATTLLLDEEAEQIAAKASRSGPVPQSTMATRPTRVTGPPTRRYVPRDRDAFEITGETAIPPGETRTSGARGDPSKAVVIAIAAAVIVLSLTLLVLLLT